MAAAQVAAAPASAGTGFGPCPETSASDVTCAVVTVPLDRSGALPGTIDLAVRRKAASSGNSSGALIHVMGGPGTPGIPALEKIARDLAPALVTRDLIVLDQRGTGASGALTCPAATDVFKRTRACADSLGARRAFYRARDFADDLEAVRVAAGINRIAVAAVSFGGVTAYDYAARHPQHVEWLLLDSPIPPTGFDPLSRSGALAATDLLKRLCRPARRCRGIARSARSDMAKLTGRLRRGSPRARFFDSRGKRSTTTINTGTPFWITRETDINPALRAQLPAALRSAARGDLAPLVQMGAVAAGAAGSAAGQDSSGGLNTALNSATVCEDSTFPWAVDSAPDAQGRYDVLVAAARRLPAATYGPFDPAGVAFAAGTPGRQCAAWPHSGRSAALDTMPAPDVPALVLAGQDDMRATIADAKAIAGRFRRSALVVAHSTGHGVLTSSRWDPRVGACVSAAVKRFLAGAVAASQCRARRPAVAAAPLVPASLARVPRERGLSGVRGRTLRAARITARITRYTMSGVATVAGSTKVVFGGMRGGRVTAAYPRLTLKSVVAVPGVVVSGTLRLSISRGRSIERGTLRVSGRGARGRVTLDGDNARGVLGGRRFSVRGASLQPPP